MTNHEAYLRGDALYGDDFTPRQLQQWWSEEEEGYSGLLMDSDQPKRYDYHGINRVLFFDRWTLAKRLKVMGLGSAYGHELIPIIDRMEEAVIVDPSDIFANDHVLTGCPVTYVKSQIDGMIAQPDGVFDLVTCFGVLHHIANVSAVLGECYRVLKPGGVMFCRDPIVTQGDWQKPRPGLTKNERGIPVDIFRRSAKNVGFNIARSTLCDFSPYRRVMAQIGLPSYDGKLTSQIDLVLSWLFSFNTSYHRPNFLQKFGPASLAMILTKPV